METKTITLPSGRAYTLVMYPFVPQKKNGRARRGFGPDVRRRNRESLSGEGWNAKQLAAHFMRYGNRCLRCHSIEEIVPDHVIPLSRGGRHELQNIQPLCQACNLWKGLRIVDFRS